MAVEGKGAEKNKYFKYLFFIVACDLQTHKYCQYPIFNFLNVKI